MIAIFFGDFIIESIDVGYIARLVIASEKYDHLGVFYFVEEEEKDSLDWIISTVHIVSEEDVAFLGDSAALAEELKQVPELAMDISANGYRGLNGLNIWFFKKKGLHSAAKNLYCLLWDHFAL